jgi:hypothetical protein
MAAGAAGFWSYVRRDDEGEGGRIIDFARDLKEQYRIRTAEELELFVDRESIQWGEEWKQRISDAIAGTTFFIPVVTPSYFRSNACRQELLKFFREAERLGLEQLLMPIYWTSVPELDAGSPENSDDEAIRAIARYQRQDFREIRFEDRASAAYRKAVAELAGEIAERAASAERVQDVPVVTAAAPELSPSEEEDEEQPGIIERIAGGEDAMQTVTSIMEEIGSQIEAVGSIVQGSGGDIQAAVAQGKGMKAVLPITARLASDLDEPSARIEGLGRDYANCLAELDPAMHGLLDLVELQNEPDPEQLEFLKSLQGLVEASASASETLGELVDGAREMSTLSRALRAPLGRMRKGLQGVLDGRAIIEEWGRRARELEDKHSTG